MYRGPEIDRSRGKDEPGPAGRRERAPERREVVAGRAEPVEENDDGARSRAFAIGAAGDADVEVAEFRELHGLRWALYRKSARARRDHSGGGGGAGSEHRPLTH